MPVAVITGGSGTLGVAVATRLAREGVDVVLLARHPERLEAARRDVVDASGSSRVTTARCDVTSSDEVTRAVRGVLDVHGAIDWVVNLAGYDVEFGRICKIRPSPESIADAERVVDCDLLGTLRMVFAVTPAMSEAGRGVIITIGNTPTLRRAPDHMLYQVARAGVAQLTACLAAQHLADGTPDLRCYWLVLGNVHSPSTYLEMDPEQRRVADAWGWLDADMHVAPVIEWLLSGALQRPDGASVVLDASTVEELFSEMGEPYLPFSPDR